MIVLVTQMFWSFTLTLIFCEFGEKMRNAFDEIGAQFEYISWYLLPIVDQQKIPMIMSFNQMPVILRGYGSITGSREVFKQVLETRFIGSKWKEETKIKTID